MHSYGGFLEPRGSKLALLKFTFKADLDRTYGVETQ